MEWLFNQYKSDEEFQQSYPLSPFSDEVILYLNELSSILLRMPEIRHYPDVVTFAFFCRKANLLRLQKEHATNSLRLGRGLVFHIAPSNVPVNFAYSLICGLLSGNNNIVRLPGKQFRQVDLIVEAIRTLSGDERFDTVSRMVHLIKYERGGIETTTYSALADVRVIWGGDETIRTIRQSPLPPRSYDIAFADRYSVCVLNAISILEESSLDKIIEGFYNDTYLFDQNACSAPQLMVWVGTADKIEKAKEYFWTALQQYVDRKYKLEPILAVDKLSTFYRQAILSDVIKEENKNNNLWRVRLRELSSDIPQYRCAGGYFSEYSTNDFNDLASIVTTKYQTLAYFGFSKDELQQFVLNNHIKGIDRIVPIGKTTDFSLIWDGYDLITMLSREISIL
ncbi:acyl-CoA reductase [Bacteroides sp. 1001136B_160425_E2]|uniref:acyl-CoA reductase n=1 Tax=Bacteroides sp. 1001136B_160425_E2 TaxID=2787083 RepID=UPI00189FD5A5|nr:acyl-CoA reductase [Bacteroides sp. 1001136B_160425_E2]